METPPVKNCLSCAHRKGHECALTGETWRIQRRYPMDYDACDKSLSGYVPRPVKPSFLQRLLRRK